MSAFINIAKYIVGFLFIFSGLVKAIDPKGLAYKMEEFFEAWGKDGFLPGMMNSFHTYSLTLAVVLIMLEVGLGCALLVAWRKKLTTALLFLLTLFFTFLTAYVLFSGKIRECGCFGNCIPLTPAQTFGKDIALLILTLLLFIFNRHLLSVKTRTAVTAVLAGLMITLGIQWYALTYLPPVDCLPYKKGANIVEGMKLPPNAIPDQYDYSFVYKKDGKEQEFKMDKLPDSTWEFVDRKQVLVKAGSNNIPLINDFSLSDLAGQVLTDSILNQTGTYYLLMVNDPASSAWKPDVKKWQAAHNTAPVYLVVSHPQEAEKEISKAGLRFDKLLVTDGVALKTAARANAVLFEMKGPVIINKWSSASL